MPQPSAPWYPWSFHCHKSKCALGLTKLTIEASGKEGEIFAQCSKPSGFAWRLPWLANHSGPSIYWLLSQTWPGQALAIWTCAKASLQGHTLHSRPQAFHTYGFHRHSQHVPLQAHRLLAWNASLFLPAEFRRKCPPPTRLWRASTAFQPWPICLGFPTHSKSIYLGFPTHFHPKGHSLPSHALAQGIQSWTWPSPSTWGAQLFALKVCSAWCKFLGSPYWVLPCLCLCFHPCFHISPTTGCLWHGKQHQDQWCAKCPSWLPKGWPHWLQKSCGHPMTHTALQVWAACLSKQLCF